MTRRPDASGATASGAFASWHALAVSSAAIVVVAAAPSLWELPAATLAVAAAAAVVLGVPHGAVDHRIARPMLRSRLGSAWFGAFAAIYLGAAAAVLGLWLVAPIASLWAFLAISVWHFGTEDAEGRGGLARIARGGAPVALPVLLHPERTTRFFGVLADGADGAAAFGVLQIAAWLWVPVAALHLAMVIRRRAWPEAAEIGALALAFAALPPLAGFAFYFLAVHSPRHMHGLARRYHAAKPVRGWASAMRAAVPLSTATLALGVAVFWLVPAEGGEERFLRTVFWGLAALTVPHVALHHLDRRFGAPRLT